MQTCGHDLKTYQSALPAEIWYQELSADSDKPRCVSPLLMLYKTCRKYFGQFTFVTLIQISKIKTLSINSRTEKCSLYVLRILVNLSLDVLIEKVLMKKNCINYVTVG